MSSSNHHLSNSPLFKSWHLRHFLVTNNGNNLYFYISLCVCLGGEEAKGEGGNSRTISLVKRDLATFLEHVNITWCLCWIFFCYNFDREPMLQLWMVTEFKLSVLGSDLPLKATLKSSPGSSAPVEFLRHMFRPDSTLGWAQSILQSNARFYAASGRRMQAPGAHPLTQAHRIWYRDQTRIVGSRLSRWRLCWASWQPRT